MEKIVIRCVGTCENIEITETVIIYECSHCGRQYQYVDGNIYVRDYDPFLFKKEEWREIWNAQELSERR